MIKEEREQIRAKKSNCRLPRSKGGRIKIAPRCRRTRADAARTRRAFRHKGASSERLSQGLRVATDQRRSGRAAWYPDRAQRTSSTSLFSFPGRESGGRREREDADFHRLHGRRWPRAIQFPG